MFTSSWPFAINASYGYRWDTGDESWSYGWLTDVNAELPPEEGSAPPPPEQSCAHTQGQYVLNNCPSLLWTNGHFLPISIGEGIIAGDLWFDNSATSRLVFTLGNRGDGATFVMEAANAETSGTCDGYAQEAYNAAFSSLENAAVALNMRNATFDSCQNFFATPLAGFNNQLFLSLSAADGVRACREIKQQLDTFCAN